MLTTLHVIVVCATIGLVLFADEQGLLWILGKKHLMKPGLVNFLHYAVAIGLAGIILTGGLLFLPAASYYLGQPAFIVKMLAVTALIINTYFIDRFSAMALTRPFDTLSRAERLPLFASGAVSALGWTIAVIGGLLIG